MEKNLMKNIIVMLIFVFTIFGLFAGMLALMAIEYQISYNKWKSSYTGKIVTNSEKNYSTSSSTTKYYDYKKYASSSDRKNKDDLESLMNMFMKGLFPPTLLYPEYTRAYEKAKSWSKKHLSQQQIKIYLTKYDRYSEDATQYALNKLNVDWKEQALLKAKSLQMFHFSKEMLVWQLINVERFTQEEADYAIEQVNFDWKEEAVKKVEAIANPGNMSKEELLELLVKKRKFTQEEAEYAIEHAQVDWLN